MSIIIFYPEITIYRGSRRITKDMLPAALREELPSDDIVQLGNLLTLDQGAVNPLVAVRHRVYRTLAAAGTPYLGGYGVGPKLAPVVSEKLAGLKADFAAAKARLLQDYQARVSGLAQANPKWASYIMQMAGSPAEVDAATKFRILKYKADIVELPGDNDAQEELNQLPERVVKEADDVLRGFLAEVTGKDKVTQRGMRVLRQMGEKLADLAFLKGEGLEQKAAAFAALVDGLPKTGPLDGEGLLALKNNVRRLLGEPIEGEQELLVI